MTTDRFYHIPTPQISVALPGASDLWDPAAHGIQLRATGVPTPPVYVYQGPGGGHQLVVGPGPARAYVVDVRDHETDPWHVVRVLAYAFFDLAYRETIRYQRAHVWRVARVR